MSLKMINSFVCDFSTVRYDRKPIEKIKLWIRTCCLKQRRHRDFFEVRRTAALKCHTKYKEPKQTINHADTLILLEDHLRPTWKT